MLDFVILCWRRGAGLCIGECWFASLTFAEWMPLHLLCLTHLQALPNVPWGQDWAFLENRCFKLWLKDKIIHYDIPFFFFLKYINSSSWTVPFPPLICENVTNFWQWFFYCFYLVDESCRFPPSLPGPLPNPSCSVLLSVPSGREKK